MFFITIIFNKGILQEFGFAIMLYDNVLCFIGVVLKIEILLTAEWNKAYSLFY